MLKPISGSVLAGIAFLGMFAAPASAVVIESDIYVHGADAFLEMFAASSSAVIVDPQIYVQQTTVGNTPNSSNLIGGEGNAITNPTGFNVGVAGNDNLQNPLLVTVAVYNGDNAGSVSISYKGCAVPSACPLATVGSYGLTSNSFVLNSSSPNMGKAFENIGLTSGGSVTFDNFNTILTDNGFTAATSFILETFAVPVSLQAKSNSPITIDESGADNGSFIIAYGCSTKATPAGAACSGGDIGQTVNTSIGMIDAPPTDAPEPGSLLLLDTGLLASGVLSRGRRRG